MSAFPSSGAVRAIGLMSGTSLDGVDAALIETDGERVGAAGAALTHPYPPAFRDRLRSVLGGGGDVPGVERELTERHAEAVADLLRRAGLAPADVAVAGFHGQTILHRPAERRTRQIGDGALLARLTGIPVVNDFRSADVAAGGEGAPFAPVFHRALAGDLGRPLAVLNIGGVANVTWIGRDGALVAFDTGPGNALVDDWVLRTTGRPYDADGALARSGRVDEDVLARLLAHPYFARPAPKSLDRDDFQGDAWRHLAAADGAATLAAFTVRAIVRALDQCPERPVRWLVGGGGRRNATLLDGLRAALGVPVDPVEAVGWDGDALEAQAFAFLAVRSLRGLPLSFPGTTGVPRPMAGGTCWRAP
ncbi:MAG: anhydro-N-acetylmuramic acid kinase [Alphaproteobacteria bacterium]|nr:anhydro-N-acetylmuramic acid kinase [Alphaproteobacteria bacterium]